MSDYNEDDDNNGSNFNDDVFSSFTVNCFQSSSQIGLKFSRSRNSSSSVLKSKGLYLPP